MVGQHRRPALLNDAGIYRSRKPSPSTKELVSPRRLNMNDKRFAPKPNTGGRSSLKDGRERRAERSFSLYEVIVFAEGVR